jgi:hypothetical protein
MSLSALSNACPYCSATMSVARMSCVACGVAIDGPFAMTRLGSLPVEHQRFIEMFILAGGSLKELAEQTGVSYPTVRSRLDKVIESLRDEIAKTQRPKGTVLDAMGGSQEAAPQRAADLIKGI